MNASAQNLSMTGRNAWARADWPTLDACAAQLLRTDSNSAEGHFFRGLVLKASRKPVQAREAFEKVLSIDTERHDAAIELAGQYSIARRNGEAADLIARYEDRIQQSPRYLDMAATTYTEIGLSERAYPLYRRANELQPGVDLFMANLAACGVYLGKIDEAREIYTELLRRNPDHQRNHYHLSRLAKVSDDTHVREMMAVLERTRLPPDRNVFIYYAIGKELEDLGRWAEAFEYYRRAGDAVTSVADYDIRSDLDLIDTIMDTCSADWLDGGRVTSEADYPDRTPVFVVGLPRTGTTLTERILSSHSRVQSLGETQFLQMVLRRESGVKTVDAVNSDIIRAAAGADIRAIGRGYLEAVEYRLNEKRLFIDKLPYNFLFLGFIAKAYPHARIVHLRRNPMDSCFSMYKQVFTWAYKFSYSLDNLGRYFVAHERLRRHWLDVLGDRIVEIEYENLVSDQENQTRRLLDRLGLEFEPACLNFEKNRAASTTASSVQVREKIHARSVERWRHFERELEPLRIHLENNGIRVD